MVDLEHADDAGGISIFVREDMTGSGSLQLVAQRLVCWERTGSGPRHTIKYRSSHPRPHFRVPASTCTDDRDELKLSPEGPTIACAAPGSPPTLVWAQDDGVGGIDVATCTETTGPGEITTANAPTVNRIDIKWDAPQDYTPDSYIVRMRKANPNTTPGAWSRHDLGGGETTFSATKLTANTRYEFKVQAVKGSTISAATTAAFTTAKPEEDPPPDNGDNGNKTRPASKKNTSS